MSTATRTNDASKLDLYRELRDEYTARRRPNLVEVSRGRYLSVTGSGGPHDNPAFQAALGALYGAAYTIKMACKRAGRDFKVMTLEGTWWGPPGRQDEGLAIPKPDWSWKLMVRVPNFVTEAHLDRAREELERRGRAAGGVQLETITEGECVQALHVGPYASEPETIAEMEAFAATNGRRLHGHRHEIYLSDPRRVPESRWRTILRHRVSTAPAAVVPVAKAGQ